MNKYDDNVTKRIMEEEILKKPTAKKKVKNKKANGVEIKETIFTDIGNYEVVFMFLYILYQIIDVLTSLSKIGDRYIKKNTFNSNFIYIISVFLIIHIVGAIITSIYYEKKYNQDKKYILATLVKPILVLVLTLTIAIIRIYFINKYI